MALSSQHPITLMENPARFNLEDALANWTHEIRRTGAVTEDQLTELKGHLRETIANLQAQGLSESEAFLVARNRVGETRHISAEFSKVNDHLCPYPGPIWKTFIFLCFILTLFFFYLGSSSLSFPAERFHGSVPISDAVLSALRNGLRPDAKLWFPVILCSGCAILAVYLYSRLRSIRAACVAFYLLITGYVFIADAKSYTVLETLPMVAAYLASVPLHTVRVLAGREDGEYFQDSLVLGLALGWWTLLWVALGARELIYWLKSKFRLQIVPAT